MPGRSYAWLYLAVCVALVLPPMWHIVLLAISTDQYSHIVVIPFLSAYLLYIRRAEIFQTHNIGAGVRTTGFCLVAAGLLIRLLGWKYSNAFSTNDALSLAVLSFVLMLAGGFIAFYGAPKGARFPLCFLVLMIPFPDSLYTSVVGFLQRGSSDVVSALYSVFGVPFIREGAIFHLPRGSIEIAEECSGIRSSIALLILSLLAGELFLRTGWKKLVLSASILPLVLVKNGVRIVTLSLLGFYVNQSFLTGRLHRDGGFIFFVLTLLVWIPLLEFLRKTEESKTGGERSGVAQTVLNEI